MFGRGHDRWRQRGRIQFLGFGYGNPFGGTAVAHGLATGLSANSCTLGKQVAKELLLHLSADTIGLFVFPDGLTYDIDNFFAGLEVNLPSDRFLPLWGGGAGNNHNLGKPTYQYCDDEVESDGVSYALLSGEAQTAWAISHSLIPIGGERIVTRSEGNVI